MGKHYLQLAPEERATIMVMRSQQYSVRHSARTVHRSALTITRELKRFTSWQDRSTCAFAAAFPYDTLAAGGRTRRARFQARRCSILAENKVLFGVVHHFMAERWLPSQIADTLKRMWPGDPQHTVFQETIYNCNYAMPRGQLRKDLSASLRRVQSMRMPRSRGEARRGQLSEALSIHVRPPEATEWLEINKAKIEVFYLPPNSPEISRCEYLNPDFKTHFRSSDRGTIKQGLLKKSTAFMDFVRNTPKSLMAYFKHASVQYTAKFTCLIAGLISVNQEADGSNKAGHAS